MIYRLLSKRHWQGRQFFNHYTTSCEIDRFRLDSCYWYKLIRIVTFDKMKRTKASCDILVLFFRTVYTEYFICYIYIYLNFDVEWTVSRSCIKAKVLLFLKSVLWLMTKVLSQYVSQNCRCQQMFWTAILFCAFWTHQVLD